MSELEKKVSFITGGSRGVGAATLEIKLILCPIDFSEFSERAYQHALSLAEHYQAKLVAQHVVELWRHPSASFAASGGLYEEFRQVLRETGEDHLQQFAKSHPHAEIQPELVVHEGSAPDSILSFAQTQQADLIVMGTHGRRGFDHLMLGSVTDRVMRRAPCPVLVVRNPPHDAMAASKERQYVHHLSRILFLCGFLQEFRTGVELCTLWGSGARRRTYYAARAGGGPKSDQDRGGPRGSDGTTR
jgi:nucleotide-binding universal stress UspA family protein